MSEPSERIETASGAELDAWAAFLGQQPRERGEPDAALRERLWPVHVDARVRAADAAFRARLQPEYAEDRTDTLIGFIAELLVRIEDLERDA